mmetsp:Transcript_50726/g.152777  ORF Transcript_50726/g.152777 Transcript_50726/m.152777 type:complete len:104 (+) Transcript_50726:669-980(+)
MDGDGGNNSNANGDAADADAVAKTAVVLYDTLALALEATGKFGTVAPATTNSSPSSSSSRAQKDDYREHDVAVGRDLADVLETLGAIHAARHLHGLDNALMVC